MLEKNEELCDTLKAERVEFALASNDIIELEQISHECELRDYVTDSMLIECAGYGQLGVIMFMARHGVPLERCGDLMLMSAVSNSRVRVVKYLVCPVGAWSGTMAVLRGDTTRRGRKRTLLDAILRTRVPENSYVTKHGIMAAVTSRGPGSNNACMGYLRMVLRRQ